jgi:hypothetical protein
MQSFPFAIIVSLTDPDNIIVVGARRREQVGDEMVCWEEDFGSRQSDQRPLSGRHDAKIFSSSVCWIGTQMQVGGQWFSAQILIALGYHGAPTDSHGPVCFHLVASPMA